MSKVGGNPQNFRPLTTEEARKRGRAGGIASARARAERKSWKETAEMVLKMGLHGGKVESVYGAESLEEARTMNLSIQDLIIIGLSAKASQGDTKAIELLRDIIGEQANVATVSPLENLADKIRQYKDEEEDD